MTHGNPPSPSSTRASLTNHTNRPVSHVKPGGWVEHVEQSSITRSDDDTIPPGGAVSKWTAYYDEIGEKLGINFRAAEASCQAMKDAGFTNVTERIIKVPQGTWPKDKRLKIWGQWFQYFVLEGLEGFVIRSFTDVLGVRASPTSFEPVQVPCLAFLTRYPRVCCSGPMRKLRSISPRCARSSRIRAFISTANGTRPFHYRSWNFTR